MAARIFVLASCVAVLGSGAAVAAARSAPAEPAASPSVPASGTDKAITGAGGAESTTGTAPSVDSAALPSRERDLDLQDTRGDASVAARAKTSDGVTSAPAPLSGRAWVHGAIELGAQTLPAFDAGTRRVAFFAAATPLLNVAPNDDFLVELGADLRLDPASFRLRAEDWDERSDFGQLLRALRVGHDGGVFQLDAGPVSAFTLGTGQLISRYSNRTNADYHPAAADLAFFAGPTRTELFASDVLGARLFAGEFALDLGRTFSADPAVHDRFHLALSAAHDFGDAGGRSLPLSVAWAELDATVLRSSGGQLAAYAGAGGRLDGDTPDVAATVGVSGEAAPRGLRIGGRLEARKQSAGFRQGMIGFDYELARFPAPPLPPAPVPDAIVPDTWSLHAEAAADVASTVVASVSAERFSTGRVDLDASLEAHAFGDRGVLGARVAAIGLGETSRFLISADARYRFLPSLYAVASGGTAYVPDAEGRVSRGVFASLGIGADFAR